MFQETVNLLLRKTFLVHDREEDRVSYRFVEKNLSAIQGYLNLARWDLYHNKRLSLFQLYNKEEKTGVILHCRKRFFCLFSGCSMMRNSGSCALRKTYLSQGRKYRKNTWR